MKLHWMKTPEGAWLCRAEEYRGLVIKGGAWKARVEGAGSIYPAHELFYRLADAQAWVEQKIAELIGQRGSAA